jgi:hypothetical protein
LTVGGFSALNPPEKDHKIKDLEKKLSAGDISKDEYWEELHNLERQARDFNHQSEKNFIMEIFSRGIKIILLIIPFLLAVLLAYFAFFHYQTPEDISIKVGGTPIQPATSKEKAQIYRALSLLKEYSPEYYAFVNEFVDRIEVSGPAGFSFKGKIRGYYGGGEGSFERKIRIVRDFNCPAHCKVEGWKGGDLLTAEFIVHEACHSMQNHNGLKFSEPQCYEMQFKFAEEVGPQLWNDFNKDVFIYDPSLVTLNF